MSEQPPPGLRLRAAAVQMTSTEDLTANRLTAERLVRTAAQAGAQLVVLPEKWQVFGSVEAHAAAAEPLEGPGFRWAGKLAAELSIDLIAGSSIETRGDSGATFNTSPHLTPEGRIGAAYRKLHMFDAEVDGVRYAESDADQPGGEVIVTDCAAGVRLGMSICYDLRFPELYRALSALGAQVLVVPAAFTLATTRDHWEVLIRARAIENQCFVVAANQIGTHPDGTHSGGRSLIVDPWGVVLAQAPDAEGVILADLDLAQLRAIRRRFPVLDHRRPELFSG